MHQPRRTLALSTDQRDEGVQSTQGFPNAGLRRGQTLPCLALPLVENGMAESSVCPDEVGGFLVE